MMFRMIKKVAIVGLILGGVGFFLFGSGIGSYVGTAAGILKESVKQSIPPEFEIKRAEALIEGIVPEIRACKKVVAEEEVAVEYLEAEMVQIRKEQDRRRELIGIQKAALERSEPAYYFAGREYSPEALRLNLERTFDGFRNNESLLESKKRLLESRFASLEAARSKLEEVRIEKGRLENQVQNLYAQLRQIESMQARSTAIAFDDSKLARAKSLLARCKQRLDVAQKMIENDRADLPVVIIPDEAEERNILAEVNEFFASESLRDAREETRIVSSSRGDL